MAHRALPMSDIFISYSSKDRPWVDTFAKVLESQGWSVWWDRQIPTGGSFNAVIRQELRAARCAIVVWSEQSVDSEWVQAEADEARKQEKYLPIRIDESDIPLGFTQRTFQSLVDWEPGANHPGFSQLLKDIERLVKSPPRQIAIGLKPWWKRIHPLWFVTLPTALAAAVVIGLMLWSIPARVQVDITTERIEFVVEATPSQGKPVLGPLDVRSVAIEKFATMTFEPETLEVADPSQYQVEKDDFPPTAWKPLSVTGSTKVTLATKDSTRHPRVTVEGLNRNEQKTFHLDAMAVAPGAHVTLETRGGKNGGLNEGLTVKVAGQDSVSLSFREPLKLIADHSELRGLGDMPFQRYDELTYRVRLPERASWIEVAASSDGPILSPTFASGQSTIPIFSRIPVTTLDFTKQESSGERVSALTGEGTITFPDYPHLGTVPIKKNEAIGLEQLDRFTIQEISLTAKASGMHLVADGMAKQIRTKAGQIPIQAPPDRVGCPVAQCAAGCCLHHYHRCLLSKPRSLSPLEGVQALMVRNALLVCLTLLLGVGLIHAREIGAQDIARLQSGVVKITAKPPQGTTNVGTGFIVRLESNAAYIVTAAHVVAGDPNPKVEFFTKQHVQFPAEVLPGAEGDDDVGGLALLLVKGKENLPSGIGSSTCLNQSHARGHGDDRISARRGAMACHQGKHWVSSGQNHLL